MRPTKLFTILFVVLTLTSYAQTVDELDAKGYQLYAEGRFDEAIDAFEQAVKLSARKKDLTYASMIFNLATIYMRVERYSLAEPMFIEANDLFKKSKFDKDPIRGKVLLNFSDLYYSTAEYRKAEQLALEAYEIFTQANVTGKKENVQILLTLGAIYMSLGRFEEAGQFNSQGLTLCSKILGEESKEYANGLNVQAMIYQSLARYDDSEQLYKKSIEVSAQVNGHDHPRTIRVVSNLGTLYQMQARYTEAEKTYKEVIASRARSIGKQHPDYAASLQNLATLYYLLGNSAAADPLAKEAIDIYVQSVGKQDVRYAQALLTRANIRIQLKDYAEAEALLREAKNVYEKKLGSNHPEYADALTNLSRIYIELLMYDKAEPLLQESREIIARTLGTNHPSYALNLLGLGNVYYTQGSVSREKYFKAESVLLEAKEITGKRLGTTHPEYTKTINNLALVYKKLGDFKKAEPLYLECVNNIKKEISITFPTLSEKERQAFVDNNRYFQENLDRFVLEGSVDNPAILSTWYDVRLFSKGLLLNTSNRIRDNILNSNDVGLIENYRTWKAKRDRIAHVYKMSIDERKQNGIDESKLEDEANALEKVLVQKSEAFAASRDQRGSYTLLDVRRSLLADEAAIEIIRVVVSKENDRGIVYAALIVTPQTKEHPELVVLKNGDELEGKHIKFYRNAMRAQLDDENSYTQFWSPIAKALVGFKRVYVSADGVYHQINLNTLFNPASQKFLSDEMDVRIVGSTRDLVSRNNLKRGVDNVLLFGFPDYNGSQPSGDGNSQLPSDLSKPDSSRRFFDGETIAELPGTRVEIDGIGNILNSRNISHTTFVGSKATESELKKLKSPNVVHIATHGFFLADTQISDEANQTFMGMDRKKISENPLLRSGLLFAGAREAFRSQNNGSGSEDGVLTAFEVMNLNLDKTDLVVMSACETGLGVSRNGEGVYGLQRAFQVAGARSVLMSLWKVDDNATQQLMTAFYDSWSEGVTTADAFKKAQMKLRQTSAHPYYWGAFVLVGDAQK